MLADKKQIITKKVTSGEEQQAELFIETAAGTGAVTEDWLAGGTGHGGEPAGTGRNVDGTVVR
ncbi:MAG: hypothetical protein ACFFD4_01215 [Candidatus Odinarchaeota archaeon]